MRESRETRQLREAVERGERRFAVLAVYLRSLSHPVEREEVRRVLRGSWQPPEEEVAHAPQPSDERLVELFAEEFSRAVNRDALFERLMRLAIQAPDPRAACLREMTLLTVRWRHDPTKQHALRGAERLMQAPDNLLLAIRRFFAERDKYFFRRS